MSSEYLIEVEDLKQHFPIKTGFFKTTPLKAVDGVSFHIKPGETLGLVGESGCGKTTVGRSILRLYEPTSGTVKFNGEAITEKKYDRTQKEYADGLSGPIFFTESAYDCGRHYRGAFGCTQVIWR